MNKKKRMLLMMLALCGAILVMFLGISIGFAYQGMEAEGQAAAVLAEGAAASPSGLGYIGAAVATGLAAVGAGIGVGIAGASAIGAISEKPELLGRTLIYIGLAEGVAIYGLIISILILGRL